VATSTNEVLACCAVSVRVSSIVVLSIWLGCGSSGRSSGPADAGRDAPAVDPARDGPPPAPDLDVLVRVDAGAEVTDGPAGLDAGDVAPDAFTPRQSRRLGMNDVSILLPLPPALETPTLATMTGIDPGVVLVPRDLFQRLVLDPGDVVDPPESFHVVAIRFDLCERLTTAPCAEGADGLLRLVLQPLSRLVFDDKSVYAQDVALHAFYPIPTRELGAVVDELRALAAIQDSNGLGPLGVSPLAGSNPERAVYLTRLRTLVGRHAVAARLSQLTLFAQHAFRQSVTWAFRGVRRDGGGFKDLVIPGAGVSEQRTTFVFDRSYETQPAADIPAGFALALDTRKYFTAEPSARLQALSVLTAALNPHRHTAETIQCPACHLATVLVPARASVAGVDPATVPARFTSPYDLSNPNGIAPDNERSLRAFGWLHTQPAISQRVINETAQVLIEMEARFPPAAP
jgi:hypothetical protein